MGKAPLKIGVAGLGMLGRGIAACLVSRGFRVVGFTLPASGLGPARQYIQTALDELAAHGICPPHRGVQWQHDYSEADSVGAFASCDFVIESIFEDHAAKIALFKEIERFIGPGIPLATNTSSLPISQLQQHLSYPQRFIGMHWAEPCHITRFLEIIPGEQTDDATKSAVIELARSLGKDPTLVRKGINGFIVNRLGYAMYREAFHLLEQGVADVETIDRAFRNAMGLWAAAMGPFRWMDLTGLKSYASAMEGMFPTLSSDDEVPRVMRELVSQGHNGVSTGRGFYDYTPQQIDFWQNLYRDHVWSVTRFQDQHFPIDSKFVPRCCEERK